MSILALVAINLKTKQIHFTCKQCQEYNVASLLSAAVKQTYLFIWILSVARQLIVVKFRSVGTGMYH
jgi:hypothetical protein